MTRENQCEAQVWQRGYWHKSDCQRAATSMINNKRLCTQHAKMALAGKHVAVRDAD